MKKSAYFYAALGIVALSFALAPSACKKSDESTTPTTTVKTTTTTAVGGQGGGEVGGAGGEVVGGQGGEGGEMNVNDFCDTICPSIVACGAGGAGGAGGGVDGKGGWPSSLDECVSGCKEKFPETCTSKDLHAALDCMDPAIVPDCDQNAFFTCVADISCLAGLGGAGGN